MLRTLSTRLLTAVKQSALPTKVTSVIPVRHHGAAKESDEEFDNRYVCFFNRKDIDGWELRKGMNDLCGMDLVPDPRVVDAALRACRRLNDFAAAVRFLEAVKCKCGSHQDIYPFVISQVRDTLCELGIDTPEELGYDKPELWLKCVYEDY